MLVDSHCHLDFPDFDAERDAIIHRAALNGVGLMVTICTRVRKFEPIRQIAEQYDQVFCSVGTHPHNAGEEQGITVDELLALAEHPKVVAIGEAGLDYHYDKAPRDLQAIGFRIHIDAARKSGLPLVIHARAADEDMIAILQEETAKGAFPFILHCFSSGAELAKIGVELGGYVSFSGISTFKTAQNLRDIALTVPRDRLLVETDAPYLAPVPFRGKRNEPAFVSHTAAMLAHTLGISLAEISDITTANCRQLFTKIPSSAFDDAAARVKAIQTAHDG